MTTGIAEVSIRPANAVDAPGVAECVNRAYRHYVDRIGKPPGPMLEDYAEIIGQRQVSVAERDGAIVGVLVLTVTEEGFLLENVAVDPRCHGTGIGRLLLELAESQARMAGHRSVYLYTHERMTENLELYARIGYVEFARRIEKDFARVYMRKQLV